MELKSNLKETKECNNKCSIKLNKKRIHSQQLTKTILPIAQSQISRQDKLSGNHLPKEHLKEERASYLQGYIQALIDSYYHELNVFVYVNRNHVVFLYNLPKDRQMRNSIIAFVKNLPAGVKKVKEGAINSTIRQHIQKHIPTRKVRGVWFPESTVLFSPLIASSREPMYSVAYRWNDVLAKHQIAISLGDIFPIFRWFNILYGDMQLDVETCVWGNFDLNPTANISQKYEAWSELITTDFILAIPLSYAIDKYSLRIRIYHISSHLGDEFIVAHPHIKRLNPSFEAIDIIHSYLTNYDLRFYGGPGFILNSDPSFPLKWFYFQYGCEWRPISFRSYYHSLYGSIFFALDIQHWQIHSFRPGINVQGGCEWSKLQGVGRKARIFLEYKNGFSEGQFFLQSTQYVAFRLSWGF